MPHINHTDTTRSGVQMDSPANTPYRRTTQQHRCRQHSLHAAHSGVFSLTDASAEEAT